MSSQSHDSVQRARQGDVFLYPEYIAGSGINWALWVKPLFSWMVNEPGFWSPYPSVMLVLDIKHKVGPVSEETSRGEVGR